MKKIFFFLSAFWLAGTGLQAQLSLTGLNLNNSYCGFFDMQLITLGPPQSNSLIVGTNSSSGYQFISANKINISATAGNTFHAGATSGSTGSFHAFIINQQLPAAILEPSDPNTVPRFSKVELGVNLSTIADLDFDARVNAFLGGNDKPGTSQYNHDYDDKIILNPYDPDHISIDAVFFRPSNPNMDGLIRHGFYYKQFVENSAHTNWTSISSIYEWRIRFAPDEVGTWNGYINVYVDGRRLVETYPFSFKVVASSNPGNVVVDNAHPRYLKFSGDNSTYFPIGGNYAWPWGFPTLPNRLNLQAPYGFSTDGRIIPTVCPEMRGFFDKLTNYPNGNGGNTTRIILTPWALQIEREKLGNYETRQIEMSELDSIICMIEARGVYCILSFNIHDEFRVNANYNPQTSTGEQGWDWHPYRDNINQQAVNDPFVNQKGIAGVDDPIDFYTNATAKAFFKKRLRYLVSRWGYSTSISMYELLTEIDQYMPDYWNANGVTAGAVADWHDEMYDYIRNDLHDPHIRTGSFTGGSYKAGDDYDSVHDTNGSLLWSKPNLDLVSRHAYGQREFSNRREALQTDSAGYNFSKPLYINECDLHDFPFCNQSSDWGIHNKEWATAFSGTCGAGLSWYWDYYYRWTHDPAMSNPPWGYGALNDYAGEYERNFVALRSFVSNIDFRNYDYASRHSCFDAAGSAIAYETFCLVRDDNEAVYGWTHNRSFNHFTVGHFQNALNPGGLTSINAVLSSTGFDPASCTTSCAGAYSFWGFCSPQFGFFTDDNYVSLFGSSYYPQPRSNGYFFIDNLLPNTDYSVDWYWTWGQYGGQSTGSPAVYMTDAGGRLVVSNAPPTGYVNNVNYPGDWAFIVSKVQHRLAGPHVAPAAFDVSAFPNPSSGVFTLHSDLSSAPATVRVCTIDGRMLRSEETAFVNGYRLDLSNEAEGVYFVTVTREGQSKSIRVVKTSE